MKELKLHQPVLFLEFYVRAFSFTGKGTLHTELPKDAFFYTGRSKATDYKLNETYIGFKDQQPYLSTSAPEELKNKLFTENTNVVSVTGTEIAEAGLYYEKEKSKWRRIKNDIKSNKYSGTSEGLKYANFKSLVPYSFSIENVLENGTIETNFPRKEVSLMIEPFQTLCFLCKRTEFSYSDFYQPNLNLVLFVKNYGFQDTLIYKNAKEITLMDSNRLCQESFIIRDFRKSSLEFDLG